MIQLITPSLYGQFAETLAEMHRLRYRVFKHRMAWDVQTSGDMEIDDFDALHPAYLVQLCDNGQVQGSVRLLPTLGPTMLCETFLRFLKTNPRRQLLSFGKVVDSQSMLLPMLRREITVLLVLLTSYLREWSSSDSQDNSLTSLPSRTSVLSESFDEPVGPCGALAILPPLATP